jgi:uncharacterized membrane protein YkvI
MRKKWIAIFQVAATYIGTVVGAGFATGKEIVEFFTMHALAGVVGIIVSGLLFVWIGSKMMVLAHRTNAYSYQELNLHLFGKTFGSFVNLLTIIILFGVTSVMLSGTGAIFQEQLGLSYQLGIVLTLFLCYLVMLKGLDGILVVNSLVVPMMIFFSVLIISPWFEPGKSGELLSQKWPDSSIQWAISPFTYAAFNLAMAQAVLVPLGMELKDERILKWGAFVGGAGLCFMMLASHFALVHLPGLLSYDIPMAEVIKDFGKAMHWLFLAVIYGEIFTTLIGNVFGISRQLHTFIDVSEKWLVTGILLFSFIISQAGFGSLLTYLYPLFGYIGLILLITIAIKRV